MPTLDDLRSVLEQRADLAAGLRPDDRLLVRVRGQDQSARRWRRVMAPALVAAAVVTVVAGTLTIAGSVGHRTDGDAPAGAVAYPPRQVSWQFSIGPLHRWTANRTSSQWLTDSTGTGGGWQQGATILPTAGGRHPRLLYTYEPALDDLQFPGNGVASHMAEAQAVAVNGRSGLFVPGSGVDTASIAPGMANRPWDAVESSGDGRPQLVWRNSDGSWSMLVGTVGFDPHTLAFNNPVAKRVMTRIAESVSTASTAERVTVPFAVRLGDAFRPAFVSTIRGVACVNWTTVKAPADDQHAAATVCRAPNDKLDDPAVPRHDAISRDLGDGTTLVVGADPTELNGSAEHNVLDTADVSPTFADPSTWVALG